MNYNDFSNKGGKKSLNNYFTQAKHEKVDFTSKDAKKMIAKHAVAVGSLGLIGKLLYNVGWKGISIFSAALLTTTAVTYMMLADSNTKDLQTSHTQKNYVEQSIEVASSKKTKINDNDALTLSQEKNPENQDVSNSNIISGIGERKLTAQSVLQTTNKMVASEETEKTKIPVGSNNLDLGAQNEKTSKSKPERHVQEAVTEEIQEHINIKKLLFIDIHDDRIVASLDYPELMEVNYSPVSVPFRNGNQMQTLVYDFSKHNSYWISFDSKVAKLNGTTKLLSGGKLGWTMNKQITIGMAGYGTLDLNSEAMSFLDINDNVQTGEFSMGYGGLFLEYTEAPNDLVHFSVNSILGFGANSITSKATASPWSVFVIFEPGASAEIHLTNFLKLGGEVSYRLSSHMSQGETYKANQNLMDIDNDGLAVGLYIKIGLF
jgi:hypothetical protein